MHTSALSLFSIIVKCWNNSIFVSLLFLFFCVTTSPSCFVVFAQAVPLIDSVDYYCNSNNGVINISAGSAAAVANKRIYIGTTAQSSNCKITISSVQIFDIIFNTTLTGASVSIQSVRCHHNVSTCVTFEKDLKNMGPVKFTEVKLVSRGTVGINVDQFPSGPGRQSLIRFDGKFSGRSGAALVFQDCVYDVVAIAPSYPTLNDVTVSMFQFIGVVGPINNRFVVQRCTMFVSGGIDVLPSPRATKLTAILVDLFEWGTSNVGVFDFQNLSLTLRNVNTKKKPLAAFVVSTDEFATPTHRQVTFKNLKLDVHVKRAGKNDCGLLSVGTSSAFSGANLQKPVQITGGNVTVTMDTSTGASTFYVARFSAGIKRVRSMQISNSVMTIRGQAKSKSAFAVYMDDGASGTIGDSSATLPPDATSGGQRWSVGTFEITRCKMDVEFALSNSKTVLDVGLLVANGAIHSVQKLHCRDSWLLCKYGGVSPANNDIKANIAALNIVARSGNLPIADECGEFAVVNTTVDARLACAGGGSITNALLFIGEDVELIGRIAVNDSTLLVDSVDVPMTNTGATHRVAGISAAGGVDTSGSVVAKNVVINVTNLTSPTSSVMGAVRVSGSLYRLSVGLFVEDVLVLVERMVTGNSQSQALLGMRVMYVDRVHTVLVRNVTVVGQYVLIRRSTVMVAMFRSSVRNVANFTVTDCLLRADGGRPPVLSSSSSSSSSSSVVSVVVVPGGSEDEPPAVQDATRCIVSIYSMSESIAVMSVRNNIVEVRKITALLGDVSVHIVNILAAVGVRLNPESDVIELVGNRIDIATTTLSSPSPTTSYFSLSASASSFPTTTGSNNNGDMMMMMMMISKNGITAVRGDIYVGILTCAYFAPEETPTKRDIPSPAPPAPSPSTPLLGFSRNAINMFNSTASSADKSIVVAIFLLRQVMSDLYPSSTSHRTAAADLISFKENDVTVHEISAAGASIATMAQDPSSVWNAAKYSKQAQLIANISGFSFEGCSVQVGFLRMLDHGGGTAASDAPSAWDRAYPQVGILHLQSTVVNISSGFSFRNTRVNVSRVVSSVFGGRVFTACFQLSVAACSKRWAFTNTSVAIADGTVVNELPAGRSQNSSSGNITAVAAVYFADDVSKIEEIVTLDIFASASSRQRRAAWSKGIANDLMGPGAVDLGNITMVRSVLSINVDTVHTASMVLLDLVNFELLDSGGAINLHGATLTVHRAVASNKSVVNNVEALNVMALEMQKSGTQKRRRLRVRSVNVTDVAIIVDVAQHPPPPPAAASSAVPIRWAQLEVVSVRLLDNISFINVERCSVVAPRFTVSYFFTVYILVIRTPLTGIEFLPQKQRGGGNNSAPSLSVDRCSVAVNISILHPVSSVVPSVHGNCQLHLFRVNVPMSFPSAASSSSSSPCSVISITNCNLSATVNMSAGPVVIRPVRIASDITDASLLVVRNVRLNIDGTSLTSHVQARAIVLTGAWLVRVGEIQIEDVVMNVVASAPRVAEPAATLLNIANGFNSSGDPTNVTVTSSAMSVVMFDTSNNSTTTSSSSSEEGDDATFICVLVRILSSSSSSSSSSNKCSGDVRDEGMHRLCVQHCKLVVSAGGGGHDGRDGTAQHTTPSPSYRVFFSFPLRAHILTSNTLPRRVAVIDNTLSTSSAVPVAEDNSASIVHLINASDCRLQNEEEKRSALLLLINNTMQSVGLGGSSLVHDGDVVLGPCALVNWTGFTTSISSSPSSPAPSTATTETMMMAMMVRMSGNSLEAARCAQPSVLWVAPSMLEPPSVPPFNLVFNNLGLQLSRTTWVVGCNNRWPRSVNTDLSEQHRRILVLYSSSEGHRHRRGVLFTCPNSSSATKTATHIDVPPTRTETQTIFNDFERSPSRTTLLLLGKESQTQTLVENHHPPTVTPTHPGPHQRRPKTETVHEKTKNGGADDSDSGGNSTIKSASTTTTRTEPQHQRHDEEEQTGTTQSLLRPPPQQTPPRLPTTMTTSSSQHLVNRSSLSSPSSLLSSRAGLHLVSASAAASTAQTTRTTAVAISLLSGRSPMAAMSLQRVGAISRITRACSNNNLKNDLREQIAALTKRTSNNSNSTTASAVQHLEQQLKQMEEDEASEPLDPLTSPTQLSLRPTSSTSKRVSLFVGAVVGNLALGYGFCLALFFFALLSFLIKKCRSSSLSSSYRDVLLEYNFPSRWAYAFVFVLPGTVFGASGVFASAELYAANITLAVVGIVLILAPVVAIVHFAIAGVRDLPFTERTIPVDNPPQWRVAFLHFVQGLKQWKAGEFEQRYHVIIDAIRVTKFIPLDLCASVVCGVCGGIAGFLPSDTPHPCSIDSIVAFVAMLMHSAAMLFWWPPFLGATDRALGGIMSLLGTLFGLVAVLLLFEAVPAQSGQAAMDVVGAVQGVVGIVWSIISAFGWVVDLYDGVYSESAEDDIGGGNKKKQKKKKDRNTLLEFEEDRDDDDDDDYPSLVAAAGVDEEMSSSPLLMTRRTASSPTITRRSSSRGSTTTMRGRRSSSTNNNNNNSNAIDQMLARLNPHHDQPSASLDDDENSFNDDNGDDAMMVGTRSVLSPSSSQRRFSIYSKHIRDLANI